MSWDSNPGTQRVFKRRKSVDKWGPPTLKVFIIRSKSNDFHRINIDDDWALMNVMAKELTDDFKNVFLIEAV